MKTHLKALIVTALVFAGLVATYYVFSPQKLDLESALVKKADTLALPAMDLTTLVGTSLNMKSFAGKTIIFNFWASWCAPCIEEVPSLVSLAKEDPNIVVIAVSGDENKDDIHAFLKSFPGFNKPPIYVVQENARALMEQFDVQKLPESFIFSPKGEMVKKISGTINWHTADSLEYFKILRQQ